MANTEQYWDYLDSNKFMQHTRQGMPPLMIVVACNGGIQGKEMHDALPETHEEIADSVYEAYKAGASMVHVHARKPDNLPLGATTKEVWWEVNKSIRERCPDIIINNTTGGDLVMSMEDRLSCLDAKPEIASLNLTPDMSRFKIRERPASLPNPRPAKEYDICMPFTYGQIEHFAEEMKKRGIKPELETYHSGGAWVIQELINKELIQPPYLIQTVMGAQTASYPTPENTQQLLREFPSGSVWLCSAIGPFQLPLTTLSILMGGHARVGLEDNLYYSHGRKFVNNAEAVARTVRIAQELNREVATPQQARVLLGLSEKPTSY